MEYRSIKYRNIGGITWEFTWPSGLKFYRDIGNELEIPNFIDKMLMEIHR